MSYGAAGRRDERRKSAIPRIEKDLSAAEQSLSRAAHAAKKAGKDTKEASAAQDELKFWTRKTDRIRECLKNTHANMGKGTSAMQKSE